MKRLLSVGGVFLALAGTTPVQAVALRPEKATDISVCDLGPNTTAVLARRTLVPGDASSKDQADAYFRLAAKFVVSNCLAGQVLIVHGESSDPVDSASLTQLANTTCIAADVRRNDVPFSYAGRNKPGFELRCQITKLEVLVDRLAELERTESTEALYGRMAKGGAPANASNSSQPKKNCDRVTLATLVQGGSSDCK